MMDGNRQLRQIGTQSSNSMAGVLRQIAQSAREIEGSDRAVWDWLTNVPIREFGFRTAAEMVADGEGDRVLDMLDEVRRGDREST